MGPVLYFLNSKPFYIGVYIFSQGTLTFKRDEEEEHIGSVGKPFNGVDMLVSSACISQFQ